MRSVAAPPRTVCIVPIRVCVTIHVRVLVAVCVPVHVAVHVHITIHVHVVIHHRILIGMPVAVLTWNVVGNSAATIVRTSFVIALIAVVTPAVTACVGGIVARTCKVEVVTVRIVRIDTECETALPINRTIEIVAGHESAILIGREHEAQVLITALPVEAKDIITHSQSRQIVEINLIDSLVLRVAQVQFVSHFICQEKSFPTSLIERHCLC